MSRHVVVAATRLRGIARLESAVISPLLFVSPLTAVLLGWTFLGQMLNSLPIAGVALVIGSIWLSQRPGPRARVSQRSFNAPKGS